MRRRAGSDSGGGGGRQAAYAVRVRPVGVGAPRDGGLDRGLVSVPSRIVEGLVGHQVLVVVLRACTGRRRAVGGWRRWQLQHRRMLASARMSWGMRLAVGRQVRHACSSAWSLAEAAAGGPRLEGRWECCGNRTRSYSKQHLTRPQAALLQPHCTVRRRARSTRLTRDPRGPGSREYSRRGAGHRWHDRSSARGLCACVTLTATSCVRDRCKVRGVRTEVRRALRRNRTAGCGR